MASIIDIRSASPRTDMRGRVAGGAEIIIFPGVRRERHPDHPDMVPKPKRRERAKPKRDRLELPE